MKPCVKSFPEPLLGGKQCSKKGGVSSTPADLAMLATKEAMKERPKRPNPKYIGKEWLS